MASIKLRGDTSGELVIEAPAVAGTNTLTLPADTANILTDNSSLPAANLTGSLPAGMGGKVLQVKQTQTNAEISSTNTVPHDNTVPTSTEGVQIMSLSFTPVSSTSTIYILISVFGNEDSNTGNNIAYPVFRGTTHLATGYMSASPNSPAHSGENWGLCNFTVKDTPASTSTQTYSVRGGVDAGTFEHINFASYHDKYKYAATTYSTMIIFEVEA